jgi:phospholipid/cholesterol/gamma-HCH transport system substrate-binding protein
LVLAVFIAACAGLFGFLWLNSGGKLPGISKAGYTADVRFHTASNLVYDSDITIAGIKVGKVQALNTEGDLARITMRLDNNSPLHEGVTVQVRNKTLIEETYLEITDGKGPALPNGAVLPPSAGKEAVELNDVLASLDKPTKDSLTALVRSLGAGTKDTKEGVSEALQGLGDLGRDGHGALSALAAQSEDLQKLTGNTAKLLAALDTRQGQIAQLVSDADKLTQSTAGSDQELQAVLRQLPGLMDTAKNASGGLSKLGPALGPVARNLDAAAPDLNAALKELPGASTDLRGLLPSLNGVLDSAPNTLQRVPTFAGDASKFLPTLNVALGDVNPMLSYLVPYGRDVAAFFTNIGQVTARGDANGHAIRLFMVFNEQSVKGVPLNMDVGPLKKNNPYPGPGQSAKPGAFNGQYPRVEQDPPK